MKLKDNVRVFLWENILYAVYIHIFVYVQYADCVLFSDTFCLLRRMVQRPSWYGHLEVVKVLLQAGADVNLQHKKVRENQLEGILRDSQVANCIIDFCA